VGQRSFWYHDRYNVENKMRVSAELEGTDNLVLVHKKELLSLNMVVGKVYANL